MMQQRLVVAGGRRRFRTPRLCGQPSGRSMLLRLLALVLPFSANAFGGGLPPRISSSPSSYQDERAAASTSVPAEGSSKRGWVLHAHRHHHHHQQQQQAQHGEVQSEEQEAASLLQSLTQAAAEASLGPPPSPSELWARVECLQRVLFDAGAGGGPSRALSVANVTSMCQRVHGIVLLDPSTLQQRVTDRQRQLWELLGPSCDPRRLMIKNPQLLTDQYVHAALNCERLRDELGGQGSLYLGRVVYSNPGLLTVEWDALGAKIQALRVLFPRQDLGRMITKRPDLLSRDMGKVRDKLDGLRGLLPDELDVPAVVAKHPELLGRNLSMVKANMAGLRRLFATVDLTSMLDRKPSLLLASTERVLVPKLARLTALLSPTAALKVAELQPTIFNREMDRVEARVGALRRSLPGLDVTRFVLGCPGFLVGDGGDVDVSDRLQRLRDALLPQELDLALLLASEPRLYSEDPQVLAGKVAAVLQITQMTTAELASKIERDARFLTVPYPSLLSRVAFLHEVLGGVQRISLSSMACMPLRRFGELYDTYEAYLTNKLGEAAAAAKRGKVALGGGSAATALQGGGGGSSGVNKRRRWMGGLLGLEREWGAQLWGHLTASGPDTHSSVPTDAGGQFPIPHRHGFTPSKRPSHPPSRTRQPPSASLPQPQQQPVFSSR